MFIAWEDLSTVEEMKMVNEVVLCPLLVKYTEDPLQLEL